MMGLRNLSLVVAVLTSLAASEAGACGCTVMPHSPLDGSNIVVHGRVLNAAEVDGTHVYEIEVREMFQGFSRTRLSVYSPPSSCQTRLEVGAEYLLHAYVRNELSGEDRRDSFYIDVCTRRTPIAEVSRPELETLRRRRAIQASNATGITFSR